MEQLLNFFAQYGLWISIFAVVGIAILGVLKYCNLFTKIEESYSYHNNTSKGSA